MKVKAKSKKKIVLIVIAAVMAAVVLVCVIGGIYLVRYSREQNKTILVTPYTVSHPEIPAAFDGKKIVHLTDLHNKDFGDQLTQAVRDAQPDIIVITGDWIGYTDTDITPAKRQLEALGGIAPIYYVAGNHEILSPLWYELYDCLEQCGVHMLQSDAMLWVEDGDAVQLVGSYDTEFGMYLWDNAQTLFDEGYYSILLFHRPEYLETAVACGADLMLSGHTHGGQIRLPRIGSIYAPSQGWFPKYDVGCFEQEDTTLIISQGLGESAYMRILCPPEIVVITLDAP